MIDNTDIEIKYQFNTTDSGQTSNSTLDDIFPRSAKVSFISLLEICGFNSKPYSLNDYWYIYLHL